MKAWIDLALMTLTFVLTIIWNVEVGIAVSVVISLLLVVRRSSRTRMTILVCAVRGGWEVPVFDRLLCTCRVVSRERSGGSQLTRTRRRKKTRPGCSSCASARTSTLVRRGLRVSRSYLDMQRDIKC